MNCDNNNHQTTQSIADYLAQLLKDRKQLAAFPNVFNHVERLLDEGMSHWILSLCFCSLFNVVAHLDEFMFTENENPKTIFNIYTTLEFNSARSPFNFHTTKWGKYFHNIRLCDVGFRKTQFYVRVTWITHAQCKQSVIFWLFVSFLSSHSWIKYLNLVLLNVTDCVTLNEYFYILYAGLGIRYSWFF